MHDFPVEVYYPDNLLFFSILRFGKLAEPLVDERDKLFFIEYFSQGLYFDIADSVNNYCVSSLIDSANSMLIYFFDLVNVF